MIGVDFEKIQFSLLGFELLEPMALISDTIMGSISIFLAYRLKRFTNIAHPFYQYWMYFFLVFGIGALWGGFAHAFYNYWGVAGKIPSWISGPTSVYCLEQAMIAIHPNRKSSSTLKIVSFWKMILVIAAMILILSLVDISDNPSLPFLPIAINTIIGVLSAAGILGLIYYRKQLSSFYKYFVLGVLIMLPSSVIFLMKINLHQWFDKNDLSHVLLTAGIIYFYIGIRKLSKAGFHQDAYL